MKAILTILMLAAILSSAALMLNGCSHGDDRVFYSDDGGYYDRGYYDGGYYGDRDRHEDRDRREMGGRDVGRSSEGHHEAAHDTGHGDGDGRHR